MLKLFQWLSKISETWTACLWRCCHTEMMAASMAQTIQWRLIGCWSHSSLRAASLANLKYFLSRWVGQMYMMLLSSWMTGWLSAWITQWLGDSVTEWLRDWVTRGLGNSVTWWLSDRVTQWLGLLYWTLNSPVCSKAQYLVPMSYM